MPLKDAQVEALVKSARVLVVDDEYYMRKVIRTLLLATGVTNVHDAPTARAACMRSTPSAPMR